MTEEKWKSPTGHPISSSETDAIKMPDVVSVEELDELINTNCQEDTKFLRTKIIDYSDCPQSGCEHLENMCITINKMRQKLIEYRALIEKQPVNPDVVSVEELKYPEKIECGHGDYYIDEIAVALNKFIDHLRARHPNGIKWED